MSELTTAPFPTSGRLDGALRVVLSHHQRLSLPRRSTMHQLMNEDLARARMQERLSAGRPRNQRRSSLRIALEARIARSQHQRR